MAVVEDKYDWEFIFTDNHSEDNSFHLLAGLAEKDDRIRVIRFSRNFGFQRSILMGYLNANGDAAIQLDCDLQDPPELIIDFINYWEQGYKVAYGVREQRVESFSMVFLRKLFYRFIGFSVKMIYPKTLVIFVWLIV